jgi:Protein of unknown function (DUF3485)
MTRPLAFVLSLALLLVGGIVHGLYAERWQTSSALDDAIAKLPHVPLEMGGWVGEEQATDEKEFDLAGARGYWSRIYRKDGKEFLAILMAGRAGRMAVHTPEVCYRGAGFDLYGSSSLHTARDQEGAELGVFWSANFVKPAAVSTELQLLWAWSDGSLWKAPSNPRWTFAGQPALYKLYLSQNISGQGAEAGAKTRDEFLRAFLPVLNRTLGVEAK